MRITTVSQMPMALAGLADLSFRVIGPSGRFLATEDVGEDTTVSQMSMALAGLADLSFRDRPKREILGRGGRR